MKSRTGSLRHSDILRCPRLSMSPNHYYGDGTCKCMKKDQRKERKSR